jgi:signal transduction histidine kinase
MNGSLLWLHGSGVCAAIRAAKMKGVEMLESEDGLLQSYRLLREIVDTIDSGIILWDSNRQLVVWNNAMERLYPELAPMFKRGMLRDELRRLREARGETDVLQHWDDIGTWDRNLPGGRVVELKRLAMADGGRLSLHTDVTAERQRNDAMMRNERLASLGRLVVGIAHELNTPVGNVLLLASTALEQAKEIKGRLAEGAIRRSDLDAFTTAAEIANQMIVGNLTRIADLVTHFKALASEQRSESSHAFRLSELVGHICSTIDNSVREAGHSLCADVAADLTMVSYPGALSQVIINLVENALTHAFPAGRCGTIRLEARNYDEQRVAIAVVDDGVGIASKNQKHVFDPFFTTRLGHGGSGLGLTVAMTLIRDHLGGEIRLLSEEGKGTTFLILLPRAVD